MGYTVIYTSPEGAHLALPRNYHPYQKNTQDNDDNHLAGNHLLMSYIISFCSNRTIITNHYFVLKKENFSGVKLQRIQPKIAKKECLQGARTCPGYTNTYKTNSLNSKLCWEMKAMQGLTSCSARASWELAPSTKAGLGASTGKGPQQEMPEQPQV